MSKPARVQPHNLEEYVPNPNTHPNSPFRNEGKRKPQSKIPYSARSAKQNLHGVKKAG